MEALTSSPASLEGARSTFVLMNETHLWMENNEGHEMAAVIERNSTKSRNGAARTLRITNAYEPGEDSVAERDREAWEKAQSGEVADVGLLYDSLEAPPEAPLTPEAAPSVVEAIRGDSVWLDTESIVKSIIDIRNPPSRSRRFWFNQITAAEDAWMDPQQWDAIAAPDQLVLPEEPIVAFFDGSKSDDSTALVGCRLSDGHVFVINVWSKPAGESGKGWVVPRGDVDDAVSAMFDTYKVLAFFGDPSDTRDDTGERFWEPMLDDWHQRYGPRLKLWSVQSGDRRHSISWDMRSKEHLNLFTGAAERFVAEVAATRFTHDGDIRLRQHVRNARRRPNDYGVSLGKEHRESRRKIDLAVCAVGARMLRRLYQNKDTSTKQRTGKVW
jgi:phage terminase large subunit-like protein